MQLNNVKYVTPPPSTILFVSRNLIRIAGLKLHNNDDDVFTTSEDDFMVHTDAAAVAFQHGLACVPHQRMTIVLKCVCKESLSMWM